MMLLFTPYSTFMLIARPLQLFSIALSRCSVKRFELTGKGEIHDGSKLGPNLLCINGFSSPSREDEESTFFTIDSFSDLVNGDEMLPLGFKGFP